MFGGAHRVYVNGEAPFKHIEPKTDNAQKFFDEHGGLFGINRVGMHNGNPVVVMKTCKDEMIVIEKRSDGIYVNNKLFAEEW